jgi:hypothetical protein
MNQNYNIISCFVEKNPKQQLKYVVYQDKICGFLLEVPTSPPILLQELVFKNPLSFPKPLPLGRPWSSS